jgi:hypothetical protein
MNTIPTSTSLVQRIENALASSDLHSAEIAGLISAAEAASVRLENLIEKLHLLLTAVTAAEKAAEKAALPQDQKLFWESEPSRPPRSRYRSTSP